MKASPGFLLACLLPFSAAFGNSATWSLNPINTDWNTPANWVPPSVPNGRSDIATFAVSNITLVKFSAAADLSAIVFNPGASRYTIGTAFDLSLSGAGIINDSGVQQHFVCLGDVGNIHFRNSATAGDASFTTRSFSGVITAVAFHDTASAANATFNNEGGLLPGATLFYDSSTAGNATITNHAGSPNGGGTVFMGGSSAGNATIICEPGGKGNAGVQFRAHSSAGQATIVAEPGGAPHEAGQYVDFLDHSNAGTALIVANGGSRRAAEAGSIYMVDQSNAENAILVANSGSNGGNGAQIFFSNGAQGGNAQVELASGALLSIDTHSTPGVSLGSLNGGGQVILGGNNLTIGANNLSTIFSGTIEDGALGQGGSLTKIGSGALELTGANTYTGGTIVTDGTLSVRNRSGSATGPGAVFVQEGTLSGDGIIAGSVTVGREARVATISPGPGTSAVPPGTMTVQSNVALNSEAVYQFNLQSDAGIAAAMRASGVTINANALFALQDTGSSTLPVGTSFVVISNTSNNPIRGRFVNLPDGGTITGGNNTFQASYSGGDGNDLMLTVVP